MRYGSIFFGVLLILVGVVFFGGSLLQLNVWPFLIPVLIIFAGCWLLFWARAGGQPLTPEEASIALEGARRGEVRVRHGAGRLSITGDADPLELAAGTFGGGLRRHIQRRGDTLDVELHVPGDIWFGGGGPPWIFGRWSPINWDVRLNGNIPLTLDMETGAGENRIDLSDVKAEYIRLQTGASSSDLTLPAHAGRIRVKISSGVASVVVRVPEGVAADIRVESGLASVQIDERRFPRSGSGYTSPDFATAENAAAIEVETGVASVEIR